MYSSQDVKSMSYEKLDIWITLQIGEDYTFEIPVHVYILWKSRIES